MHEYEVKIVMTIKADSWYKAALAARDEVKRRLAASEVLTYLVDDSENEVVTIDLR